MRFRHHSHGYTQLGLLLAMFFLGALVFTGWQIIPFYYSFYDIQGSMHAQAKVAQETTDTEIRKYLLKRVSDLGIPLESEADLKINRVGNRMIIEMEYEEVFYIDLGEDRVYDLWVFYFNPHVDVPF